MILSTALAPPAKYLTVATSRHLHFYVGMHIYSTMVSLITFETYVFYASYYRISRCPVYTKSTTKCPIVDRTPSICRTTGIRRQCYLWYILDLYVGILQKSITLQRTSCKHVPGASDQKHIVTDLTRSKVRGEDDHSMFCRY